MNEISLEDLKKQYSDNFIRKIADVPAANPPAEAPKPPSSAVSPKPIKQGNMSLAAIALPIFAIATVGVVSYIFYLTFFKNSDNRSELKVLGEQTQNTETPSDDEIKKKLDLLLKDLNSSKGSNQKTETEPIDESVEEDLQDPSLLEAEDISTDTADDEEQPATEEVAEEDKIYLIVKTDPGANCRREPNSSAVNITGVYKGTTVEMIDERDGWYLTRLENGTECWIASSLVEKK